MNDSKLILEARPSWLNFFPLFVLAGILILLTPLFPLFLFIALVFVGVAIWQWAGLVLRVYEDDRIVLEKGVLSKETKEFYMRNIRTIDVKQSFFQRMFNIGDIMLATAGTAGYEDVAKGMANPKNIKEMVMSATQSSTD